MRKYTSHFTQLFVYQLATSAIFLDFTYSKFKIGKCI